MRAIGYLTLAQTTFLRALDDPTGAPDDPWDWPVMRENNLYALDRLDEVASLPGPKYVFAHLVTTHPPYVHNADGSYTGRAQVARLGDIAVAAKAHWGYPPEWIERFDVRLLAPSGRTGG